MMSDATKICTKCNTEKPISQYSWRNKRKGLYKSQCKSCHAEYRRQHYLDNHEKYKKKARRWNDEHKDARLLAARRLVLEYLLEHPCVDCGETNPIVLEFDHVRGKKKEAISIMLSSMVTFDRLQAEIDKCDVRCANCHRMKTAQERGWHIVDLMAEYNSNK